MIKKQNIKKKKKKKIRNKARKCKENDMQIAFSFSQEPVTIDRT